MYLVCRLLLEKKNISLALLPAWFFSSCCVSPLYLHSFPTRRSSDLSISIFESMLKSFLSSLFAWAEIPFLFFPSFLFFSRPGPLLSSSLSRVGRSASPEIGRAHV